MNKKTKIIIKFAAILIASVLAGYAASRLCLNFKPQMDASVLNVMACSVPAIAWICNILLCVLSWQIFRKERKLWDRNKEDEDILDRMEYRLKIPMLIGNIAMILNLFMFSLTIFFVLECSLSENGAKMLMLAGTAAMVFGLVWILVLQSKIVSLEKTVNPEKQGEILDMNFQKEWLNSCDEAQKVMIYRAAYSAFRAVNIACMFCWAICFIGLFTLGTGLLSVFILAVIHMTLIVTYSAACMKQEKPHVTTGTVLVDTNDNWDGSC